MQKKLIITLIILGIIILGIVTIFSIIGKPEANFSLQNEKIKIGFVGPLTGDVAPYGEDMLKMIKLAIKDNNLNVELIVEDGQCDGKTATSAIQKLNLENVKFIIGGLCSGETLAMAPIAESNKILLLSPSSTSPNITNSGDYIFRIIPSDVYQAKIAAKIAKERFDANNIAIVSCQKDFCYNLKEQFKQDFNGTIILDESFSGNQNDFKTIITKINNSNVNLVYVLGYEADYIAFLKQYKEMQVTKPILGVDTIDNPNVFKQEFMKDYPVKIMFPFPKKMYENTTIVKKYKETYNAEFTPYAPYTYDALNIISNAIQETKSTDPTIIKDYLYSMSIYQGITGDIQFDSKGDLINAQYELHEIINGLDKIIGDIN